MKAFRNAWRVGAAACLIAVSASAGAQEAAVVNFMSANETSCAPYPQMTAQVFGFWEKEGIKINFLNSDTSIPYSAFLQNGQADIAMMDSAAVLQGIDNDLPLKVVYEQMQQSSEGVYVTLDSPITSLADVKDMTLGLASDKDLITAVIALQSIGQTLESAHVATVVVGDSGPTLAKAIRDKEVAAFIGASSDIAALQVLGVEMKNLTPIEVLSSPANNLVVWGPTLEEKRPLIEKFARGWAMAQHAGVLDTKLSASACRTKVPESFEDVNVGMGLMNRNIYVNHLRRTKDYGELEFDVWKRVQGPLVTVGELKAEHDPATFLDTSFLKYANDWTTDDIKKAMYAWRDANTDKLIP